MANGKKNYFRHSFFARNDIKLLKLRDEIGVGFYFYYFSLLELCGEESCDELKEEYVFHDSTIRSLWGVNLKKSEHVASVMNAVRLLEFKKLEKSFWFRIPNLSKYLGKYQSKKESNTSNKRKEKKRKEKENKVNETNPSAPVKKGATPSLLTGFDFDHLVDIYPCNTSRSSNVKDLQKIIKTQDQYDLAKLGISRYASLKKGEPRKYIKMFRNFIKEELWEQYANDQDAIEMDLANSFLTECISRQESINQEGIDGNQ